MVPQHKYPIIAVRLELFGYSGFTLPVVLSLLNVLRNPSTTRGIGARIRTSFGRHGN